MLYFLDKTKSKTCFLCKYKGWEKFRMTRLVKGLIYPHLTSETQRKREVADKCGTVHLNPTMFDALKPELLHTAL